MTGATRIAEIISGAVSRVILGGSTEWATDRFGGEWALAPAGIGIGWTWDGAAFRPAQPFASWTWDGSAWQPPVPMPDDAWAWDETTGVWVSDD